MPAPFWLVLVAALLAQPTPRDPSVAWLDGPAWEPGTTVTWRLELRTGELIATPRPGSAPSTGTLELSYREWLEFDVLSHTEVRIRQGEGGVDVRSVSDLGVVGRLADEGRSLVAQFVTSSPCPLCRRQLVGRRGADGWQVTPVDAEPEDDELRALDHLARILGPDGYPGVPFEEGSRGVLGETAFARWVGLLLTDVEASGGWRVDRFETRDAGRGAAVDLQALVAGELTAPHLPPFRLELILTGESFRSLEHRVDHELTLRGLAVLVPAPDSPESGTADMRGEVTITLRTEVR